MNPSKFRDLDPVDRFCLMNAWLAGELSDEQSKEIASDLAHADSHIIESLRELEEGAETLTSANIVPFRGRFNSFKTVLACASIILISAMGYFASRHLSSVEAGPDPVAWVATLETRVESLDGAPATSPEVRKLRSQIVSAPVEKVALAWQSEKILAFMTATNPLSPPLYASDVETRVDGIMREEGRHRSSHWRFVSDYIAKTRDETRLIPGQNDGRMAPKLVNFLLEDRQQSPVGMVVPFFFHTMDETDRLTWDRIVALAGKDLPMRIINTRQYTDDLAPTSDFVLNFGKAIDWATSHHAEVFAYVNCDGGGKSLARAEEEVRKWHEFYGNRLKGIYFDNQAHIKDGKTEFFRRIFAFTAELEPGWQIMSATEGEYDETYAKLMKDNVVCFKTNGKFPRFKGWEKSFGRERFGAMIFDIHEISEAEMKKVAAIFGWVFVTQSPEQAANKVLPEYLNEEAKFLKDLNAKKSPDAEEADVPPSTGTSA